MTPTDQLQAYREDLARWKGDREALDRKGPGRIVASAYVDPHDPHPDATTAQVRTGRRNLFGEVK